MAEEVANEFMRHRASGFRDVGKSDLIRRLRQDSKDENQLPYHEYLRLRGSSKPFGQPHYDQNGRFLAHVANYNSPLYSDIETNVRSYYEGINDDDYVQVPENGTPLIAYQWGETLSKSPERDDCLFYLDRILNLEAERPGYHVREWESETMCPIGHPLRNIPSVTVDLADAYQNAKNLVEDVKVVVQPPESREEIEHMLQELDRYRHPIEKYVESQLKIDREQFKRLLKQYERRYEYGSTPSLFS
jgi:hypothetical protein